MMLGYYRMPEQTRQVIRGGWFYTGDMGYLDEDGFLHVMGRIGNVILGADGKKIFPDELEQAFLRSPLIQEVVVVSRADSSGVSRPVALIYPNRAHVTEMLGGDFSSDGQERLLKRALAEINGSLPPYKRIDSFRVRDREFPKTATRKIKRDCV